MPRKKRSELVAGLFIILAMAAGLAVVVWIGAASAVRTPKAVVYFAVGEGVDPGVKVGAALRAGGQDIGKVTSMEFVSERRETLYRIDLDVPLEIHQDAKARVASVVIGNNNLVLADRGSKGVPLADEEHPAKIVGGLDEALADVNATTRELRASVEKLSAQLDVQVAGTLAHDVKTALGKVNEILGNIAAETDAHKSDSMLAQAKMAVTGVNGIVTDARPKIQQATSSMADAVDRIDQYSRKDVGDILTSMHQSIEDVRAISKNLADVSQQAREIVVVNRENVDTIIDNMTQVSANLKSAAKEIRRAPWKLLYKPDEKESHAQDVYDAAQAFSNGAEELDRTVAKLDGLIKGNPQGLPANHPELVKLRKELDETFARFSKYEQALWEEFKKGQ